MTKFRIIACVAAASALFALTCRIGLSEIGGQLRNLRYVLPVVLLAGIVRLLLQTHAWWIALRADGIRVAPTRLIAIRLASQAAGYLTVLGPVMAEPAKLVLLRETVGAEKAAPATLIETGTYWFTSVILGLAGTCAAAFLISDARIIWVAAVFGGALALLGTRRSLVSPMLRLSGRHAPKWLGSAEAVELRIRSFRDRYPKASRTILGLEWLAQLVTLCEVGAVFWVVGLHFSAAHVLTVEAAGRVIKIFGAWIPGRIGADEGGAAVSFALLGFPPAAGLMLVLARRVRDLLWAGAGIVCTGSRTARRPPSARRSSQVSFCLDEQRVL